MTSSQPHCRQKPPTRRRFVLAALLLAACGRAQVQVIEVPTEKEANEVLVLLDRFGVSGAEKVSATAQRATVWQVSIDPAKVRAARLVLDRLGLPREDRGGLGTVLESGGVIPSAQSERARLVHAKSDKLARTLESHDRVLTARVHIVLPEEELVPSDGELSPSKRPTASVYLRYLPGKSNVQAGFAPSGRPLAALGVAADALQRDLAALGGLDADAFARLVSAPPERAAELLAENGIESSPAVLELLHLYGGAQPPEDPAWPISRAEVTSLVSKAVEGLRPWDVDVVYGAVELEPATSSPDGPLPTGELAELIDAEEGRLGRLEQLDRPFALVAGLLALLSAYLFFLLIRERRRASETEA